MKTYFLITTNGSLAAKFADDVKHVDVFALVKGGQPIKGRFNLPGCPSMVDYEVVIDPAHLVAVAKAPQ